MNCISSRLCRRCRLDISFIALLALSAACGAPASESSGTSGALAYRMLYDVGVDPDSAIARVEVSLEQSSHLLREVRWRADPDRFSGFRGDGNILSDAGVVTWLPPANGGSLSWDANVPNERASGSFDAWLDPEWGLFRAEDVIPRAATRTRSGAHSETRLRFHLPPRWSVITQYGENDGYFRIDNSMRRFDQPTGWIVMGDLGVRRESIADIKVVVAGPVGASVRRMDMLALLNWTLPELARILPALPARLTIVSAGTPMWRGGLSAPRSLFIHADRPLLSENATSTLLHEVLHTMLGIRSRPGDDWIDEGLAEYYSLELLRRSGTITGRRYETALSELREWSNDATALCGRESSGATTALAVSVLAQLDREIRRHSADSASLDDVVRALARHDGAIDLADLAAAAARAAGEKTDTLHGSALPGCRSISASHTIR